LTANQSGRGQGHLDRTEDEPSAIIIKIEAGAEAGADAQEATGAEADVRVDVRVERAPMQEQKVNRKLNRGSEVQPPVTDPSAYILIDGWYVPQIYHLAGEPFKWMAQSHSGAGWRQFYYRCSLRDMVDT